MLVTQKRPIKWAKCGVKYKAASWRGAKGDGNGDGVGKGKTKGNGNLIKARPERQTSECLMPGNKQPVSH